MRIGIVGAGAIGSVVGGLLTEAGHEVTLIDQWPEHVEAMRRGGLRLSGACGDHRVRVDALHLHEAQKLEAPFEAVFLAVKGYDTDWAALFAARLARAPDGVIVDFQNGVNDERVAALAGRARTLGCVILISAALYEPGHAIRTDTGTMGFKIGELDGEVTPRATALARVMTEVAPSVVTPNLMGERWGKLAVNCMANPVAGVTGLGSAEVRTTPGPRRVAIQLGAEVVRVGRAKGYAIEPLLGIAAARIVDAAEGRGLAEVEADMEVEAKRRAGGRPSFLQDVLKGRRTEIEHLNGYVSACGREVGVATPFNDAMVDTVRRLGIGFKPAPDNLRPLLDLLPRA